MNDAEYFTPKEASNTLESPEKPLDYGLIEET